MSKPVCAVVGIGPKNGASFARTFAQAGYQVAMLSRSTKLSSQLAEELPDARAYACDVTDAEAVTTAFGQVEAEMGPVDALIYNAGSGSWGNIEEAEPEDFERAWRINAMGSFLAAKAVIPAMKAKGQGSIVVVGATASLRGKPFTTVFAPAKAAQRSLAQAIARHVGPMGIHTALMIIDGQIARPESDEEKAAPQRLDPDDIAEAALQLVRQPRSAWTFELDLRPFAENW